MDDLYGSIDEKKKKRKKAGSESSKESSLRDWFGRKGAKGKKKGWVDCNAPDGKGGYKSCGRSSGEKRKRYPACRPTPGACKERGKGKSWGKKAKKSKKNEELYKMDLYQIIEEEIEAVISEIRTDGRGYSPASLAASQALASAGIAKRPESVRRRLMQLVADLDSENPSVEEIQQLAAMVAQLMDAAEEADRHGLEEAHSKEDEEKIKDIISQLKKASKMHAGQADELQKVVDDSPDEELKEGMNCGCGKDPCETYGKNNEKLIIMVKEELEAVIDEKKRKKRKKKKKKSSGKKDACYNKVKSRYKVWPSAYASGALVKCRKVGAKNWGNSKKEALEIEIENTIVEVLEEKKKKPCKPSKGKRFAKRVNGKCRSFGQKGQAKGGGDRIRPGTKKGDAYCARSAKIKKCKNPPCANDLSRKKWKCRGSKSMREAIKKVNESKNTK
tara:strand:- start:143 stop:1477 length:1335 start_codon:yes stop_codon:yes gene_type:complete